MHVCMYVYMVFNTMLNFFLKTYMHTRTCAHTSVIRLSANLSLVVLSIAVVTFLNINIVCLRSKLCPSSSFKLKLKEFDHVWAFKVLLLYTKLLFRLRKKWVNTDPYVCFYVSNNKSNVNKITLRKIFFSSVFYF